MNEEKKADQTSTQETAYFAGGCFWCITPTFRNLAGVTDVVSGYSGGEEVDPTYQDVKAQKTTHRETIRIDYDPEQVDYLTLLDIFLGSVDPHDPDGQFIDRGFSYTLAVYYRSEEQKQIAEDRIRKLEETSGKQVYISIEPFRNFYSAEEYHQDYLDRNPDGYCHIPFEQMDIFAKNRFTAEEYVKPAVQVVGERLAK